MKGSGEIAIDMLVEIETQSPMRLKTILIVLALVLTGAACKKAPQGRVFFISPADGAVVKSPLRVEFGVEGMTVQAAGDIVPGTGHHHLIINGDAEPAGTVVPSDETHKHFGKGQTEAEIKLEPGKYRLTLQFANGHHESYGPEFSTSINITVEK